MSRIRRWLALPALVALLGGVALVLDRAGGGGLATPALDRPGDWVDWALGVDPVVGALAVLRLVALALVWYALVTTVAGGVLRLAAAIRPSAWAHRGIAAADRLTAAPIRRWLAATAGFTLAIGPLPLAGAADRGPPAVVQLATTTTTAVTTGTTTAVTVDGVTVGGVTADGSVPPSTLRMRLVAPGSPPTTGADPADPAAADPPGDATPAPAGGGPAGAEHIVARGECFWSIAEGVLSAAWGRPPTDAEIVRYWRELIDHNRHHLADPANADLIYPGQVFALPEPPVG